MCVHMWVRVCMCEFNGDPLATKINFASDCSTFHEDFAHKNIGIAVVGWDIAIVYNYIDRFTNRWCQGLK